MTILHLYFVIKDKVLNIVIMIFVMYSNQITIIKDGPQTPLTI
jgi:hypothetical protein